MVLVVEITEEDTLTLVGMVVMVKVQKVLCTLILRLHLPIMMVHRLVDSQDAPQVAVVEEVLDSVQMQLDLVVLVVLVVIVMVIQDLVLVVMLVDLLVQQHILNL